MAAVAMADAAEDADEAKDDPDIDSMTGKGALGAPFSMKADLSGAFSGHSPAAFSLHGEFPPATTSACSAREKQK